MADYVDLGTLGKATFIQMITNRIFGLESDPMLVTIQSESESELVFPIRSESESDRIRIRKSESDRIRRKTLL